MKHDKLQPPARGWNRPPGHYFDLRALPTSPRPPFVAERYHLRSTTVVL